MQHLSNTQTQAGSKVQTPKTDGRQEHLQGQRISPKETLELFKELRSVTGEELPIITTSKGEKLQIVSYPPNSRPKPDDANFRHEIYNLSGSSEATSHYYFNANGVPHKQTTEDRQVSQEFLHEIKNFIAQKKAAKGQ